MGIDHLDRSWRLTAIELSLVEGLGAARSALFGQAVETGGMVGHEVECLFGISDCEVILPNVVSLGLCVPRHFW